MLVLHSLGYHGLTEASGATSVQVLIPRIETLPCRK